MLLIETIIDVIQTLSVSNDVDDTVDTGETGISFIEENEIPIKPNLTKGRFTLELPDELINSAEIIISDPAGKEIGNITTCTQYIGIDLSSYPAGMYFVLIRSGRKTVTKKIIKY